MIIFKIPFYYKIYINYQSFLTLCTLYLINNNMRFIIYAIIYIFYLINWTFNMIFNIFKNYFILFSNIFFNIKLFFNFQKTKNKHIKKIDLLKNSKNLLIVLLK